MWVTIMGVDGSGKNAVAEHLISNHGYKNLSVTHEGNGFRAELKTLSLRMESHHLAHNQGNFDNSLTIRSAIDSMDFYPEYLLRTLQIKKEEYEDLRILRSYVLKRLPTPDCAIFLEIDKINAHNRTLLKNNNQTLTDEEINLQSEIYEEIANEIAIPLIRVSMNVDFLLVLNEIDFGLSSIRASNLQSRSIFKREFYR